MGAKYIGACFKEDAADIHLVPPGFVPLTSFTLKRVYDDTIMSCTASAASDPQPTEMDNECNINDDVKLTRSLRRRPWINYHQSDSSSDEELESEQFHQVSNFFSIFYCSCIYKMRNHHVIVIKWIFLVKH